MNCTSPPGGTCTSGYKSLLSFSDYLTSAEAAECNNLFTFSQLVGIVDPGFCLNLDKRIPPLITNNYFCCNGRQLYLGTGSSQDYRALPNGGLYCQNPNFNLNNCTKTFNTGGQGIYPTKQYFWACPNAGIIDALVNSISGDATTEGWGFGFDSSTAFSLVGPYGCYDALPDQNENLYKIRQQFCPDLDAGYSYSENIMLSFTPSSWSNLSLTAACCARANQASISGDSGEKCDFMACFQSPQCGEILRDFCASVSNQRGSVCARFKSWTSVNLFNENAASTTFTTVYPAFGSYPSSMDQAFFSLLSYCSTTQYDDIEFCGAIVNTNVLDNHLLFPRIDTIYLSDVIPSFYTSLTNQTVSFSITNRSNILLKSLTVIQATTSAYTVSFATRTLYPGSSTNVTVTTTLSSLNYSNIYEVETSDNWVSDSFNANDDCTYEGSYFLTGSMTEPTERDFPALASCNSGDVQIGTYQNVGETTLVPLLKASPDDDCLQQLEAFDASLGFSTYPGCACPDDKECVGGFNGECEQKSLLTRELTSGLVCAANDGWELTGMYFIDSITWLTNINDTTRQDFPVFGGFAVGMQPNPFNYFLTPNLIVFPLTSNNYLV